MCFLCGLTDQHCFFIVLYGQLLFWVQILPVYGSLSNYVLLSIICCLSALGIKTVAETLNQNIYTKFGTRTLLYKLAVIVLSYCTAVSLIVIFCFLVFLVSFRADAAWRVYY